MGKGEQGEVISRVSDGQAIHFWRIASISKLNTIEAFRNIVVIYKTYSLNLQKKRYNSKPVYFGWNTPFFLVLFWDLQNLSQKVHVLDKVETRGVEREETEVNLAIALLLTVLLIFVG